MDGRNIVLIGMPGAGKSTVGVLLAKAMKRPFLDTDLLVQCRQRRGLQEIIESDGMEAFIDIEARVIRDLNTQGHIIATGGSVVYREGAMAHLRATGITIFLSVPFDTIAARLRNVATRGVAKRREQTLRDLYDERQPLYTRYADITIDTAGMNIEEVVSQLAYRLHDSCG